MQIGKAALLGLASVTGIGAPVIAGINYHKQVSILDKVKDDVIPVDIDNTESESVWTTLKTKLSSKEVRDSDLLKIKTGTTTDWKKLQEWCFNAYEEIYENLFLRPKEQLLADVRLACRLTIKEKLGDNKYFEIPERAEETTNQNHFKSKLTSLKSDEEATSDPTLKAIKDKAEDNWQQLQSWCGSKYEKSYQGSNTLIWKLAEKYCKKD